MLEDLRSVSVKARSPHLRPIFLHVWVLENVFALLFLKQMPNMDLIHSLSYYRFISASNRSCGY